MYTTVLEVITLGPFVYGQKGSGGRLVTWKERRRHDLVCMQVESTILAGPHANLTAFLKSLARLEASTAFLSQHRWACPSCTSHHIPG